MPDTFIHEPAKMPLSEQKRVGVIIGQNYPAPIINRQHTRQHTLEAYKLARESV